MDDINYNLVEYSKDMLRRDDQYDVDIREYKKALEGPVELSEEIEILLEKKVEDLFCENCSQEKLYNASRKTYYCPVCE